MEAQERIKETIDVVPFGRRKVAPRVCVADSKTHIRNFFRDKLEDIGFIACECERTEEIGRIIAERQPDLFVLGMSAGGIRAHAMLEAMAAVKFTGSILLFGPPVSPAMTAISESGKELGLAMLPLLPTPFSDAHLRDSVAAFLPDEAPPKPPVDFSEALHANWLELWYQPKIDARTLKLGGAEALIRMRHPTWGTVPPACFLPDAGDPHFQALSEFVTARAIDDWHYFVTAHGHIEIAINLPVAYFHHPAAIENLTRHMPKHAAFDGLIVEVNGQELIQNLPLAKEAARKLRFHNIGVSIDDLGADWPALMELNNFPFVEIKIDRTFVAGCATDRLKRSVCRRILELADGFGARTVAEGVETRADFLTMREIGVDMIQGFYFAKPMEPQKFSRKILGRPVTIPDA